MEDSVAQNQVSQTNEPESTSYIQISESESNPDRSSVFDHNQVKIMVFLKLHEN